MLSSKLHPPTAVRPHVSRNSGTRGDRVVEMLKVRGVTTHARAPKANDWDQGAPRFQVVPPV